MAIKRAVKVKMKEAREETMEKQPDIMESWMQSQRDMVENMLRMQREMMSNWNLYEQWFTQIVESSKVYTSEAMKVQNLWKNTVEKQIEVGKGITKGFFEMGKKAA